MGAESNLQIIPLFFVLGAPEIKITDSARRLIANALTAFFIICRVGGGDSFAGGVITGFLDGKDFKSALEFGVAASALKHTMP